MTIQARDRIRSSSGAGPLAAHGGHAAWDLPGHDLAVEFVSDPAALEPWTVAWRRLVEVAAEVTPFLGPEFLVPSLEHLGRRGVGVALVTGRPRQDPGGAPVLAGLFPLDLGRRRGSIWLHTYSFLGTPLVRDDAVDAVWDRFLSWALVERGLLALRVPQLPVDGPVFRGMLRASARASVPSWVQEQFLRAEFRPDRDADTYELRAQARKVRRNLRRSRKQLAERGAVTADVGVVGPAAAGPWIDEFLELERSGWKGREGTALGSEPRSAAWFRDAATRLASAGALVGARLAVDGRPVAMGALVTSAPARPGQGVYFKIGFDEEFADVSAGALLQQDLLRWLHGPDGLDHVDSCARPGHPMIEKLWGGRRLVQTTWLGAPTRSGRAAISILPLVRALKRVRRPKR